MQPPGSAAVRDARLVCCCEGDSEGQSLNEAGTIFSRAGCGGHILAGKYGRGHCGARPGQARSRSRSGRSMQVTQELWIDGHITFLALAHHKDIVGKPVGVPPAPLDAGWNSGPGDTQRLQVGLPPGGFRVLLGSMVLREKWSLWVLQCNSSKSTIVSDNRYYVKSSETRLNMVRDADAMSI